MKRFIHPKSPMDVLEDVKTSIDYDDDYYDEDIDETDMIFDNEDEARNRFEDYSTDYDIE